MTCFASDSSRTAYKRGGSWPQRQSSCRMATGWCSGEEAPWPRGRPQKFKGFSVLAIPSLRRTRMPLPRVSKHSVDSEIWGSIFYGGISASPPAVINL